jgi:uncharacterized phage-associated protein
LKDRPIGRWTHILIDNRDGFRGFLVHDGAILEKRAIIQLGGEVSSMAPIYREDKTTQAAEHLLELRNNNFRMSYLKLLKLLYLADRAALQRWGRPISYDSYYSLDKGPLLSTTYNRINDEPNPDFESYWQKYIRTEGYEVVLRQNTPKDQLSPAELRILEEVYAEHGSKNRWELVKYTHLLPEYQDPKGSNLPITIQAILRAGAWPEDDIEEVVTELETQSSADRMWNGNDSSR